MKQRKVKKDKKQKSNFLAWSIIVASVILGTSLIYAARSFSRIVVTEEPVAQEELKGEEAEIKGEPEITETSHIRGEFSALVTVVEFSDFQCPFCERFHTTVLQVLEDYPSQVRWVFKHFPLDALHPQARPAAEASECAAEQNKFWEFADALFENQSSLSQDIYSEIATDLGLNLPQFNQCLTDRKYKNKVEADYQEGIRLGVRGTPASFINGELLVGAVPYESLVAVIESILAGQ